MNKAKSEAGKRDCLRVTKGLTDTNQKAGLETWTGTPRQADGTSETQEPNQARDPNQNLHWQQEGN